MFAKVRDWLTTIYQTVAKLRAPITADIGDVFDRLLSSDPERQPAIVPEAAADVAERAESPRQIDPVAVTSDLATLHEADLAATEPAHASPVAATVRDEAEGATTIYAPRLA